MKRPVIIRRIVSVEPVLDHLIDEPAVDPLVEMRRLHPEEEDAQNGAERDDQPRRPIHLRGALSRPSMLRAKWGESASALVRSRC